MAGLIVDNLDRAVAVEEDRDDTSNILLGLDLPLLGSQAGGCLGETGNQELVFVPK